MSELWINLSIGLAGSLVGTAIGALVGWKVTAHYSKQASKELIAETNTLRHLSLFLLRVAAKAGLVEPILDEHQLPSGYRLADEYGGDVIYEDPDNRSIARIRRGRAHSALPKWEEANLNSDARKLFDWLLKASGTGNGIEEQEFVFSDAHFFQRLLDTDASGRVLAVGTEAKTIVHRRDIIALRDATLIRYRHGNGPAGRFFVSL